MVTYNIYGLSCMLRMSNINPHIINYITCPKNKKDLIKNKFFNSDKLFIENVHTTVDTVTRNERVKINSNSTNKIHIAANCKSLFIEPCPAKITIANIKSIKELRAHGDNELIKGLSGLRTAYIQNSTYVIIDNHSIEELYIKYNFFLIDAPNLRKLTVLNFMVDDGKFILHRVHPDCEINYVIFE